MTNVGENTFKVQILSRHGKTNAGGGLTALRQPGKLVKNTVFSQAVEESQMHQRQMPKIPVQLEG